MLCSAAGISLTASSSLIADPTPGLKMFTSIWPVSIAIRLLAIDHIAGQGVDRLSQPLLSNCLRRKMHEPPVQLYGVTTRLQLVPVRGSEPGRK